MYNYLPLVLILSITPAIALAQISLNDWEADVRYTYDSQASDYDDRESSTIINKTISTNLCLDSSLSNSTEITGVFTLSRVSGDDADIKWTPPKKDFVRYLYITHETKDGTAIKAGKLSSETDKSKLVQNLDVNCNSGFATICDGSNGVYLNTAIDKNSILESITIKNSNLYNDYTSYRVRLKHSTDGDNYYFGLSKSYYDENPLQGMPSIRDNSNTSIDLFGELSVDGSETDKWSIRLSYSDYKYDENIATLAYDPSVPTEYDMPYSRNSNSTYIQLSRLIFIDDFRIDPRISRTVSSGKSGTAKITTNNNIVSTTLGQEESTSIVSDDIGIGIEYPIQNGRIRLSSFFHKQTEKNLTGSLLINDLNYNETTISALYNLNINTSVKAIYTEINSKNSDIYNNNLKAAAVEVIFKF
jgi:hypothetical protein